MILYENHGQDCRVTGPHDICPTVSQKWGTGGNNVPLVLNDQGAMNREDDAYDVMEASAPIVMEQKRFAQYRQSDICACLRAKGGCYGGSSESLVVNNQDYIVRRLTPREAERLQGFPDDYTAYGADGERISDTRRYAAIGNSITVSVAQYVLENVANILSRDI